LPVGFTTYEAKRHLKCLSKEKKAAGKYWLNTFLRQTPQKTLRTPQALTLPPANVFTPEAVAEIDYIFEQ
jgi:hypothetical protein